MKVTIEWETLKGLIEVAQDATGLIECNCSLDGCDGSCTHSCAERFGDAAWEEVKGQIIAK